MIKYYKSIYKTDKIQFIYSMGNIFEVVKSVPLKGNMHAASDGVLVSTSDLIF